MKKILVPVDFSDCSRNAADFAANLAMRTGSGLNLLHVLQPGDVDTGIAPSGGWASAADVITVPHMIGLLKHVKKKMQAFILENGLDEIPVEDVVETGDPVTGIKVAAEKYDADLIVMGTHGASGMRELFVGSVAEKVAQHPYCPVISVREKSDPVPVTILFASDFSEEADSVFEKVKEIASAYGAGLHLVKIADEHDANPDVSNDSILNFAIRHQVEHLTRRLYPAPDVGDGILRYAAEVNAGMIAIGTHGRRGLNRFFNGSISGELINHCHSPVLTVHFSASS